MNRPSRTRGLDLLLTFALSLGAASAAELNLQGCTFVGGSKWERAQGCGVDPNGNVYICGNTDSSDLPTTPGAFQRTYAGDTTNHGGDAWVAKLSPDLKTLIWCTYIGGSGMERAYTCKADAAGNVYVSIWTSSANFPTTPGAYDTSQNGDSDIAIVKLKPDGSGLIWSTFVGGSLQDQSRNAMFVDTAGNVYVSGHTASLNFPTTPGGFQRTLKGQSDAFVFKLSADGGSLLHSTLLGGSAGHPETAFCGVSVHTDGTVYVGGYTISTDFPVTPGAYQTTFKGNGPTGGPQGDAFVARFAPDLSSLIFCTYLGGTGGDHVSGNDGLTVDAAGQAHITGETTSVDFPVTPSAYSRTYKGGGTGYAMVDAFVSKLSSDGKTLLASTYIGSTGALDESSGIGLDAVGNVYLSGNTAGTDFPVTADALQKTFQGGATDAFLVKLSSDLSTLKYSTYFGGAGAAGSSERARELVLDANGNVIFSGDSDSTNFPVTAGAYDTTQNGSADGFAAKFTPGGASPGSLQFSASNYSAGEGNGSVTISVTRTGGSTGAVGLNYATANGSANTGSDYSAASGTLSWAGGDSANKTFSVTILNDTSVEGNETFNITLSSPTGGATLGSPSSAAVTIVDNDVPANLPPVLSSSPWANPNPTSGLSTTVNVVASDPDSGPALLTYTWAKISGPGNVTFSPNGTTLSDISTATFTAAGSYSIQVTVSDSAASVSGNVTVTVNQTLTSIIVAPSSASVLAGATQQFTATARDQFGTALASQPAFAWTVSGGGKISSSGLFTAGTTAGGPFTVTASSGGKSGTASVSVTATSGAGPLAHWKLNETSGLTAGDSSGNNNTGTLTNGPTWTTGKLGGAVLFDGANDTVSVPDASSLSPASSALTLSAWMNSQNLAAGGMVLSKGSSGAQYQLRVFAGSLRLGVKAGGTVTYHERSFAFANNTWYHIAGVYDGANMRVYVNGAQIGTATAKTGALAATDGVGVSLGNRSGSTINYFKGKIDDARIYSRALSAAEVAALANPTP